MAGRPHINHYDIRAKIWKLQDKFTTSQIAQRIGVTVRAVNYWITPRNVIVDEKDKYRNPTSEHIKKIQRLYNYHLGGY